MPELVFSTPELVETSKLLHTIYDPVRVVSDPFYDITYTKCKPIYKAISACWNYFKPNRAITDIDDAASDASDDTLMPDFDTDYDLYFRPID